METITRVDILEHRRVEYDDGTVECFRVRAYRWEPATQQEVIAWSGLGFETRVQAESYARAFLDGARIGQGASHSAPLTYSYDRAVSALDELIASL